MVASTAFSALIGVVSFLRNQVVSFARNRWSACAEIRWSISANSPSQNSKSFIKSDFLHFKNIFEIVNKIKKHSQILTTKGNGSHLASPQIAQLKQTDNSVRTIEDKEKKVYNEAQHFQRKSEMAVNLFKRFRDSILALDTSIVMSPMKDYLAFKKRSNIVDVSILKKGLKLWINLKKGKLDDPKNITRNVADIGHWGNGDYEIIIKDDTNLEYILGLIKQAINKV